MTILFLALWLQMSAHPQVSLHCVAEFGCNRGERWGDAPFLIQGVDSSSGVLSWASAETPRAADETDDRARSGCDADNSCAGGNGETDEKPRQNIPPLSSIPADSIECWNDSGTHDYLCQDSKGRTVDVTKAMLRLMDEVDVPAVQVGKQLSYDCGQGIACIDHYVPVYSCKDKSRILEHDENSPAKYWCRKVQP